MKHAPFKFVLSIFLLNASIGSHQKIVSINSSMATEVVVTRVVLDCGDEEEEESENDYETLQEQERQREEDERQREEDLANQGGDAEEDPDEPQDQSRCEEMRNLEYLGCRLNAAQAHTMDLEECGPRFALPPTYAAGSFCLAEADSRREAAYAFCETQQAYNIQLHCRN